MPKRKFKQVVNLLEACAMGLEGELTELLQSKKNIDINTYDNHKWTALHHAVNGNHIKCVNLLLKRDKIKVNAKSYEGLTPLHLACASKDHKLSLDIARMLLQKRRKVLFDCSNEEVSPVSRAIENHRLDLVKLFAESGADLNVPDLDEERPLFYAVREMNEEIVKYLLEERYCQIFANNINERNVIHLALYFVHRDKSSAQSISLLRILLNYVFTHELSNFGKLITTMRMHMEDICNQEIPSLLIELIYKREQSVDTLALIENVLALPIFRDSMEKLILIIPLHDLMRNKGTEGFFPLQYFQNCGSGIDIKGMWVFLLFKLFSANQQLFHQYMAFCKLFLYTFICYVNQFSINTSYFNDSDPHQIFLFLRTLNYSYKIDMDFLYEEFVHYRIFIKPICYDKIVHYLVPFSNKVYPFSFKPRQPKSRFYRFKESGNLLQDILRFNLNEGSEEDNEPACLYHLCRSAVRQVFFQQNKNFEEIFGSINSLKLPQNISNSLLYKTF